MSAAALIAELRREGVELVMDGENLRFRPAHRVDLVRRAALATHKAEIIKLLSAEKAPKATAPTPLRAAVVIEAHGQSFVVIPDSEPAERWVKQGHVPLTVSEVERLTAATGRQPLPAETVRAIALTKKQFPGAAVQAARSLPATTEKETKA